MTISSYSVRATQDGKLAMIETVNGYEGEHITIINQPSDIKDVFEASAHYIGTIAASESGDFTTWCLYENDTYADIHYAIRWEALKKTMM